MFIGTSESIPKTSINQSSDAALFHLQSPASRPHASN